MIGRLREAASQVLFRRVGTLDGYVLRRFFGVYVANLVSFSLIFVLLDLFEHLDEFSRKTSGALELADLLWQYYSAFLPIVFCRVLGPIVMLTAGLFTITLYQRSNEIVPMLANGRSYRRIFLPIFVVGALLTVATFLVQELWVPSTRQALMSALGGRGGDEVLVDKKYPDSRNDKLVLLKRYVVRERRAEGVTVLPVGRRGEADREEIIEARSMRWVQPELEPDKGYWLMEDGWIQRYEPEPRRSLPRLVPVRDDEESDAVPRLMDQFDSRRLETTMIPQDLEVQEAQVLHMSLAQLHRKMTDSTTDRSWTIKFYSRFFDPLAGLVLLALGLPVIVHFSARNVFFGALLSALVAGAYFVSCAFFHEVAVRGFLPGAVGAAFSPFAFLALAICWLRYLRT